VQGGTDKEEMVIPFSISRAIQRKTTPAQDLIAPPGL
jgi:hypothetical protein